MLSDRAKAQRPKNIGPKPGGQPGHIGQTLQQNPAPDITHSIALDRCPDCGADLCDEPIASEEKRQVFDLPPIAALLAVKKTADDARQRGQPRIQPATLKPLLAAYDRWVATGLKDPPEVAKPAGKRGRVKQSRERNLQVRMPHSSTGRTARVAL